MIAAHLLFTGRTFVVSGTCKATLQLAMKMGKVNPPVFFDTGMVLALAGKLQLPWKAVPGVFFDFDADRTYKP